MMVLVALVLVSCSLSEGNAPESLRFAGACRRAALPTALWEPPGPPWVPPCWRWSPADQVFTLSSACSSVQGAAVRRCRSRWSCILAILRQ